MDTVTHALAGALVGEALFRPALGRRAPVICAGAALLPDAGVIAHFVTDDPFFILRFHRGITHALPMMPLAALVAAGLACLVFRRDIRFGWFYLAALAGVATQIGLDLMTSYGTMILEPFSDRRFALDWIYVFDPWLLAIIAGSLVLGWRQLKRGGRGLGITRRGLVAAGLYLLLLGALHQMAIEQLAGQLDARSVDLGPDDRIACLPAPGIPFAWDGIYTQGDAAYVGTVWVVREGTIGFRRFESDLDTPAVRSLRRTPEGETYFWFARFPYVEQTRAANGDAILRVRDLRIYDKRLRSAMHYLGLSGHWPYTLRARVGPDGTVESVSLDLS